MNEFKINNFIVKEELPVIALRDMALFPTLIVPLAIGRAKTLFALDKAMASDKLAVFVTQKDSSEDITPENLYSFGTIGRINVVFKTSGGTARVEVEGIKRAKILNFSQTDPYLTAKVEPLDVIIADDIEVKALSRSVLDNFTDVSEKGRPLPPGFLNLIRSIKDPEQVLYLIVYHLSFLS